MLRIPNRQNPRPQRYHTEFSVQKLSAMYNNGFQVTSENTLREFPLVIATVAKVSRKRGLWLVVRVKKDTMRDRFLDQHCVLASGCLVSMIKFFALIILSCLHLGQNRGKVTNSVSRSICKRVLAPHHGHKTQRFSSPTSFMLFSPSFCNQTQPWQ